MTKKIPRNHVICDRCLELGIVKDLGPKVPPEQKKVLQYQCPRCGVCPMGRTFDDFIREQEDRIAREQAELDFLEGLQREYTEPDEDK